jgi:hypothetical protein
VNCAAEPLTPSHALEDAIRSADALGELVPVAVRFTVVDPVDDVLPYHGMSAYSAPLEPPLTQIELPVTPGVTCPTVIVSGDVQTVVALFDVFVVSATVAVGESLQAVTIAPPNNREAQAMRDNMIYTFRCNAVE